MRIASFACLLALAVAAGACKKQATAESAPAPPSPQQLESILASADAADGKVDHVVDKCPGCRLAMPGKADFALDAHGYQLHFCSDECRSKSSPQVDTVIAQCK